jgi:hypothetical protein
MIGSLWTRLRPAAMVVTLGLCFLASSPLTAMSQDPPAEAAAAAPADAPAAEAAAPAEKQRLLLKR